MSDIDFRHIGNSRISSRMKQAVVLLIVTLIGMIISCSVNAQDYPETKTHQAVAHALQGKTVLMVKKLPGTLTSQPLDTK